MFEASCGEIHFNVQFLWSFFVCYRKSHLTGISTSCVCKCVVQTVVLLLTLFWQNGKNWRQPTTKWSICCYGPQWLSSLNLPVSKINILRWCNLLLTKKYFFTILSISSFIENFLNLFSFFVLNIMNWICFKIFVLYNVFLTLYLLTTGLVESILLLPDYRITGNLTISLYLFEIDTFFVIQIRL